MSSKLPLRCQQIFDCLSGRGDVPAQELCRAIEKDISAFSDAQMYLGSYITRLNRRIRGNGLQVIPGSMKGTYRLTSNS